MVKRQVKMVESLPLEDVCTLMRRYLFDFKHPNRGRSLTESAWDGSGTTAMGAIVKLQSLLCYDLKDKVAQGQLPDVFISSICLIKKNTTVYFISIGSIFLEVFKAKKSND